MSNTMKIESRRNFESLRHRARREVDAGNWDAALELCDQAVAWAERHGERRDLDLAHCNRGGLLVIQGHGPEVVGRLREILLGSTCHEIRYQAAYAISRHHEMRKESERGLFYARLCLDHARQTGQAEAMARAHNQIGHQLARDSRFEPARDSYRAALELLPPPDAVDHALIRTNIGYCQVVLGQHEDGFRQLYRSLRFTLRAGAEAWELPPRTALAFAHLDLDRPRTARRHASRALELAERMAVGWQVKNALYLLGEAEKLLGRERAARRCFGRLQRDFYPDDPVIPDFLMATDVRKLLNLMA